MQRQSGLKPRGVFESTAASTEGATREDLADPALMPVHTLSVQSWTRQLSSDARVPCVGAWPPLAGRYGRVVSPAHFDPLAEAARQWRRHRLDEPSAMHAAISIIHAQQLVVTAIDRSLKPLDLTFARYEVLMLLSFSNVGALPTTKMGERLMVHPTGITRLVDKLQQQGLVTREPHPVDRRSTLVRITPRGRSVADEATDVLVGIRFGIGLTGADLAKLTQLLGALRMTSAPDDETHG